MKTKHNSLILFYAIIFSILSCTEASKQVKKDIEKIETTQTKSAPNLKIIEQNHEFYLSKKIVNSYTLENKIISGDGYHIEFPYVHYYQGDLTEGYTNQLIENFVFSLKPNGRNVKYIYKITKKNDNILSIVFSGEDSYGNKLKSAITIDLHTTNEITFPAIIWPNAKEFDDEFKRTINKFGINDINLMDYTLFYIEGDDIVFQFNYPSESSEFEFRNIKIPLDNVMEILNRYFGEHPIS